MYSLRVIEVILLKKAERVDNDNNMEFGSPMKKKQRVGVNLQPISLEPPKEHARSCLPPLKNLPIKTSEADPTVVRLLQQATVQNSVSLADAARRSTFPYLQDENQDIVQQYTPYYAAAQLYYAEACLMEASLMSDTDKKKAIDECFRAIDLALLRAGVQEWKQIAAPLLMKAEEERAHLYAEGEGLDVSNRNKLDGDRKDSGDDIRSIDKPPQWIHNSSLCQEIARVDASSLSVQQFLTEFVNPKDESGNSLPSIPVIITKAMDSWPALKKWNDLEYIKRQSSARLVPVEVYDVKDSTQTYLTDSWEQRVMSLGDYIDQYINRVGENAGDPQDTGYLAQHQIFDQIQALRRDIQIPEYCSAVTDVDTQAPIGAECHLPPLISGWFGPAGTVSPLHNDPYHNILCQVIGSKYLRLYSLSNTNCVYAREGPVCNNSYVDVDNVDKERFPLFETAPCWQCVLGAGEMLYIPRYCHKECSVQTAFVTLY